MEAPLISVIVPVYNVAPWLPACVESLLGQTYQNFELILVDDGSTDDSGSICDAYIKMDDRVKVFHQENGGLSCARNTGLDAMSGSFIAIIDSDDMLAPTFLETMLSQLQKNQTGLCICNFDPFIETSSGEVQKEPPLSFPRTGARLSAEDVLMLIGQKGGFLYVSSCNKLYRAEIFDWFRFAAGKLHEDEFAIHHILWRAGLVSCIPAPLYLRRNRPESITTSRYSVQRLDVLDAMEDRAQFCIEKGIVSLYPSVFRRYINTYAMACARLKKPSAQEKKQLKHYRKLLAAHWRLVFTHTSILVALSFVAAMLFPTAYYRLGERLAKK